MSTPRIIVVGGGLVGLATAYALVRQHRHARVRVLEKEPEVGRHQSTHNSGVLHAGLSYVPGSFKARLAVDGARRMVEFCRRHGIRHEICGKLVVAADDAEIGRLATLLERGRANGLTGLRWLSEAEAREMEPHVHCVAALHVPEEGITEYGAVCTALMSEVCERGGEVRTSAAVLAIARERGRWRITAADGEHEAEVLVNCAGLHADRVARLAGATPPCRIIPFRGEYYRLRPDREFLVRHLIYPVPDPAFPFLGVHFTRQIGGGIEAGPNAVLALAREGYSRSTVNVRDVAETLGYPGLWRFLRRYPRMSWDEVHRSLSRRLFCASLRRLVPELQETDLAGGSAGVRAQAMFPSGELVQDFLFVESAGALHVLNAPSPAATASLAIGQEIARRLDPMLSARPPLAPGVS